VAYIGFWSRIAILLGGIESYRKACFYLIGTLRDIDSGKPATLFSSRWRRGLKLYAGRGYAMQVFQVMANGKPPAPPGFPITLNFLEKHILPLRSSEIVDGPYDRLEYYFYVLPQELRRNVSVLHMNCEQKLPSPDDPQCSSSIPGSFIHAQIKWTKWEFFRKRILPIPLFGIGICLWFFANAVSSWAGHGFRPEYVELIAFFVLAVAFQNWGVFTGALKTPPGMKA
jgi:hypothetical protein